MNKPDYNTIHAINNKLNKIHLSLLILLNIGNIRAQSESEKLKIYETKDELCTEIQFTEPLQQEIDYNEDINKEGHIVYLRETFNEMLINPEIYKSDGLILFPDTSYLQSKFIVLNTDYAPGGGYSVVLLFKDKPDRIFYAWVYEFHSTKDYYLRSFKEYDTDENNSPSAGKCQRIFINQICNDEIGL